MCTWSIASGGGRRCSPTRRVPPPPRPSHPVPFLPLAQAGARPEIAAVLVSEPEGARGGGGRCRGWGGGDGGGGRQSAPQSSPQLPGSLRATGHPPGTAGGEGGSPIPAGSAGPCSHTLRVSQGWGGGNALCMCVPPPPPLPPGACSRSSASTCRDSTPWPTTVSAWTSCWWISTTGATRAANGCSAARLRAACQVRPDPPQTPNPHGAELGVTPPC